MTKIQEHSYFTKYGESNFLKTDKEITPSEGVTFKINTYPRNDKEQLFFDLIKWLDTYKPNAKKERIKFKLQGATFNMINKKVVLAPWFRRLQKLSLEHFKDWNINKFIIN
jgi:hypothetical protein